MDAVPMPAYTRQDGIFNIITHYPDPLCAGPTMPDVGKRDTFHIFLESFMFRRTQDVFLHGRCRRCRIH